MNRTVRIIALISSVSALLFTNSLYVVTASAVPSDSSSHGEKMCYGEDCNEKADGDPSGGGSGGCSNGSCSRGVRGSLSRGAGAGGGLGGMLKLLPLLAGLFAGGGNQKQEPGPAPGPTGTAMPTGQLLPTPQATPQTLPTPGVVNAIDPKEFFQQVTF